MWANRVRSYKESSTELIQLSGNDPHCHYVPYYNQPHRYKENHYTLHRAGSHSS